MARSAFVSCFFAGAGSVTIGSMGQGAEFTKCIRTSDLTTKTLDDDITLLDRDSGGCCPVDSVPGIKWYSNYQGAQIVCGFKEDGAIAFTSSSSGGATTCTTNKCYVMKQNIPCKDGTRQRLNGCCGPKPQTNFQDKCKDYDKTQTFNKVAANYCLTYHKTYKMEYTKLASDDIKDNVLQVDKVYSYTPCEGSSLASGSTSTGSGSTSTGSGSTWTGSGSSVSATALLRLGTDPASLAVCQGDCDTDTQCPGDSKCIQRTAGSPAAVAGCTVGDSGSNADTDYCSNPATPEDASGATPAMASLAALLAFAMIINH